MHLGRRSGKLNSDIRSNKERVSNTQLFSTVACEYALFPAGISARIVRVARAHRAGAGRGMGLRLWQRPGQRAAGRTFFAVFATDSAAEQIAAAKAHPRVSYSVAPAEHSGLAAASVDLVTVAQALHWFDVEAFYAEARRVARPGALLAVWNYPRPQFVDAELDRRFAEFYRRHGGPYWPPERQHVEHNYRDAAVSVRGAATPAIRRSSCAGDLEQVSAT